MFPPLYFSIELNEIGDEEEENLFSKLDLFQQQMKILDEENQIQIEPQMECEECGAVVCELTSVKEMKNPFNNSPLEVAFSLTNCFGLAFMDKDQDQSSLLFSRQIRKEVKNVVCKEFHKIGYMIDGTMFVVKDSKIMISYIDKFTNQKKILKWEKKTWENNFQLVFNLSTTKKKLSYLELMEIRREIYCPLCEDLFYNKKKFLDHLRHRKHREEEKYWKMKEIY